MSDPTMENGPLGAQGMSPVDTVAALPDRAAIMKGKREPRRHRRRKGFLVTGVALAGGVVLAGLGFAVQAWRQTEAQISRPVIRQGTADVPVDWRARIAVAEDLRTRLGGAPRPADPQETSPRETSPRETSPRETSPQVASPQQTSEAATSEAETSRQQTPSAQAPADDLALPVQEEPATEQAAIGSTEPPPSSAPEIEERGPVTAAAPPVPAPRATAAPAPSAPAPTAQAAPAPSAQAAPAPIVPPRETAERVIPALEPARQEPAAATGRVVAQTETPLPPRRPAHLSSTAASPQAGSRGPDLQAATTTTRPVATRTRVFVHYSALDPAGRARAEAISRRLAAQGFEIADLRGRGVEIMTSNVRFYHAQDRSASSMVRDLVDASFPGLGVRETALRDFGTYPTPPAPGVVELWLASVTAREAARR